MASRIFPIASELVIRAQVEEVFSTPYLNGNTKKRGLDSSPELNGRGTIFLSHSTISQSQVNKTRPYNKVPQTGSLHNRNLFSYGSEG